MTSFIYDRSHHLTGFEMLYPDGEYRPSFLLVDVQTLTERRVTTDHLRAAGLEEGVDFFVASVNDVPLEALGGASKALGSASVGRGGARRYAVLAIPALIHAFMTGNSDFGRRMRLWVYREVIPGILRDGYYRASEVDEMVTELRAQVDHLTRLIEGGFGDMTLGDLAGWDG